VNKKSLALLFIITFINSSFAFGDKNSMPPKITTDSEYLRNLEYFNPATKAGLLIRKKELDHLQNQEYNSVSTSSKGFIITLAGIFAAGIAGGCLSKGDGQKILGIISGGSIFGGLVITIFGSKETINHNEKKEQLRKETDTIIKDDTGWKLK
jgi:hypothetical protein